jgi:hypothetical protein
MWRGNGSLDATVAAPFVWRCLNGRSMTPSPHPAHRTGRADLPHPALGQGNMPGHVTRCTAPGTSRSSQGCPNLHAFAAVRVALNQGPFPPPALPGFTSTTSPSATPPNPVWPSRASSWCQWPLSDGASRVASVFLLCVLSPLPRRKTWVHVSLASPALSAFLPLGRSRLPHHAFRGLLSVHSRYGPHIRRMAKSTLYTRGFSRFVASTTAPVATGRSESCRVGKTVP